MIFQEQYLQIKLNTIDDFTGTKVLKVIKEINPGIQIIIFTASNKVWNIEKWTQTQIFTNSLLWTGFWIVFDRFFGI